MRGGSGAGCWERGVAWQARQSRPIEPAQLARVAPAPARIRIPAHWDVEVQGAGWQAGTAEPVRIAAALTRRMRAQPPLPRPLKTPGRKRGREVSSKTRPGTSL